jgi:hypothetical protein
MNFRAAARMKTRFSFVVALAVLALGVLACRAQTPEATPPAPSAPTAAPGESSQVLQTRKFIIPRDGGCFPNGHAPPFDPLDAKPVKPDTRALLESMGISFDAPGSTASFNPENSVLTISNTAEQLEKTANLFFPAVRQGLVHLEVFSLPPLAARKALIAHPKEADLYGWLDTELAKPDPIVKLERHSITIVPAGQRAKTEAIDEIPHPTEFDAPKIPQSIGLPVASAPTSTPTGNANFAPWPHAGPKPDSIETRNAGDTFEVEITIPDDGKTVDLNLAPETSRRVGIAKFGLREDIYQPIYETQRSAVQASGRLGQPMLISTFSPPVNTGVPGGNTVDRTWLLFVTVRPVE